MTTGTDPARPAQSDPVLVGATQNYTRYHLVLPFSERRLLLLIGDALIVNLSVYTALFIWRLLDRETINLTAVTRGQWLWYPVMTAAWWIVGSLWNLYSIPLANQRIKAIERVLATNLTLLGGYLVTYFVFPPGTLPRLFHLFTIIVNTSGMLLWRALYATIFQLPQLRHRILVVGAGLAGQVACELLRNFNSRLFELVGFIDDDPNRLGTTIAGLPVLGSSDNLLLLAHANNIDEIVIAETKDISPDLFDAIVACQAHNTTVTTLLDLAERYTKRVPVEHIDCEWALNAFNYNSVPPLLRRLAKRLIDILVSLGGLICFGLIYPIVALAIKLEDGGPVFYTQTRAGLSGKPYKMRKFRTMRPNAESSGAVWAKASDNRITKVGRFLRKCRVDELPQVLNILRGEMSIVGPRPERPEFIKELEEHIPFYRMRLAAKPGLTGWAQIHYRYGNSIEDALIKLEYDLYYIKYQSPWLDLYTILRTLGVVFGMKGM